MAFWADRPVDETDLHAIHAWLVGHILEPKEEDYPDLCDTQEKRDIFLAGWRASFRPNDPWAMAERLRSDPFYYDAKVAGLWVFGICAWIGSGWCSLERKDRGRGVSSLVAQIPHLSNRGKGVNRPHQKIPHFRDGGKGVNRQFKRQLPQLRPHQGIFSPPTTRLPHLSGDGGAAGAGIHASAFGDKTGRLYEYLRALSQRLRRVRVCCGDWKRVVGPSVTYKIGVSAILLDPPYSEAAGRTAGLYNHDDLAVAHEVREWCLEEIVDEDNHFAGPRYLHPKLRIALCGYIGEGHEVLEELGWEVYRWEANGGYSNQRKRGGRNHNRKKEVIYFSPNCLKPAALPKTGFTGTLFPI